MSRRACLLGLAALLPWGLPSLAQEGEVATTTTEEIFVTGSLETIVSATTSATDYRRDPPRAFLEEAPGGSAVVTLAVTRSGGTITGATARFDISISGFLSSSSIILAHLHEGASGVAGPVRVDSGISPEDPLRVEGGHGSFSRRGIPVSPAMAVRILGNPAGWYVDIHTTLHPQGVARGQLVAASTALAGARVVLTGSVVAGDRGTLAVVDPRGATLSGVVVDVAGERLATGRDGRAAFTVPTGVATLVTLLPHGGNAAPGSTAVIAPPRGFDPTLPPTVTRAPRFPTAGDQITIEGGPFDGDAGGDTVRVGDREVPVLASCPTALVIATPPDWPLGDSGPLTVATARGTSAPVSVTFIRLRLEASSTTLARGQSAEGRIHIEGTKERVNLRVTNLTPAVIQLKGGEALALRTGGGSDNSVTIRFRGVSPGGFVLNATAVDEHRAPAPWTVSAARVPPPG